MGILCPDSLIDLKIEIPKFINYDIPGLDVTEIGVIGRFTIANCGCSRIFYCCHRYNFPWQQCPSENSCKTAWLFKPIEDCGGCDGGIAPPVYVRQLTYVNTI